MPSDQDAIIAIATAPGRGGIGVVRISGRALQPLITALLGRGLTPRHATYCPFPDADGQPIDHGIALYFPAPHSYTGEDVLELQGHGGPVVLQQLIARCLAVDPGAHLRLAEPGEFTRRAYLNDKLDLAQAEAVADLIAAQTVSAAKSAAASLSGVFSAEIQALVDQVIELRLLVEATLDFPEEEIDFLQSADALGRLKNIETQLDRVLATAQQGALLRDGLKVVLAGLPNAGKSSLLNALAGEDIAIVTPIAGTTRDKIQQTIQLDGVPLTIIDTAGLRDTDDAVESIGIARSWSAIGTADLVIHLHDLAQPDPHGNAAIAAQLNAHAPDVPVLRVFNKVDATPRPATDLPTEAIALSAVTHAGLDTLRERLRQAAGIAPIADTVFTARTRHLNALGAARAHLQAARDHASVRRIDAASAGHLSDAHLDLFAEELRLAQQALNQITGEFSADDLLGEIFSSFCIGK